MRNPTQGIEHNMVKKANNMRAIGLLFQMYAWMFKTRDIIWFALKCHAIQHIQAVWDRVLAGISSTTGQQHCLVLSFSKEGRFFTTFSVSAFELCAVWRSGLPISFWGSDYWHDCILCLFAAFLLSYRCLTLGQLNWIIRGNLIPLSVHKSPLLFILIWKGYFEENCHLSNNMIAKGSGYSLHSVVLVGWNQKETACSQWMSWYGLFWGFLSHLTSILSSVFF